MKGKIFATLSVLILVLSVSFVITQDFSENLNDDLIAYWKFDGLSGSVVDSVTGIYNGTTFGVARGEEGIIENSFGFSGGYLDVENITYVFPSTFSSWIQLDESFSSTGNILDTDIDSNLVQIYGSSDLKDGLWHHIVVVRFDQGTYGLYVDGISEGVLFDEDSAGMELYVAGGLANLASRSNSLSNTFYIGRRWNSPNAPFHGKIDEVGYWSRALSDQEILQLYNNGNGTTYPVNDSNEDPVNETNITELEERILELEKIVGNLTIAIGNHSHDFNHSHEEDPRISDLDNRVGILEGLVDRIMNFIRNLPNGLSKRFS